MEALNNTLALLLWAEDENGEDDVAVYSGTLIEESGLYYLRRDNQQSPEIREEWLPRIKAVPEDLKETLLDCNYQLSLTVGDSNDTQGRLELFGLKWPNA